MTPEESKELKELVEFLKENQIGEFSFERGDLKVRIKFDSPTSNTDASALELLRLSHLSQLSQMLAANPAAHPAQSTPAALAPGQAGGDQGAPREESIEDAAMHTVRSPIVGTFYESPSPGAPAFVKLGDQVEAGQVLCIVEAMKLMNEIESDAAGEVVKRLVSNGQPVEYGQPLFILRSR